MMQMQGRFKTRAAAVTVWTVVLMIWAWMLLTPVKAWSEETETATSGDSTDFTEFSLEELKDVVIVSASKKPEMVSDTAAAVYVITQEDISRSGVTSSVE